TNSKGQVRKARALCKRGTTKPPPQHTVLQRPRRGKLISGQQPSPWAPADMAGRQSTETERPSNCNRAHTACPPEPPPASIQVVDRPRGGNLACTASSKEYFPPPGR